MSSEGIVYRKVYEHDFDSIGSWWVFHWDRPTGVAYPWGVLAVEKLVGVDDA